ncbi:nitrogenase component 1 [Serpentinicella alkaliphila]|uniref:Nitrogenase molybdenum-iron protein NifN n=1 Tax=Serpentinicella alkaliphila TaxID=1734049 RepID=A0A4R2TMC7_9FIRM|nr:nitrogenase molybdenum-iron protein NifN [Serpentinicella alkaliphila]
MKTRNFVNLTVNPCKMCMPMGAATAFKGIENTVIILHGSQGCSTYIRRHMATHYNEPIDIASSSLNEKEIVYGGATNLKQGLKNVIKLYNPKVIGVATTCLAETIGEDINSIVTDFKEQENIKDISIITVPTPGYGPSEHEGYYLTLRRIVESITVKSTTTEKVNIVAGNLTPGDIRRIKEILELFDIGYTLLPDISDTLDSGFTSKYNKLSSDGTKIEDIKNMSGAVATIEMGMLVSDKSSPGKYLEDKYQVPLYRCPLPIGLENTDTFIELISNISGRKVPEKLLKERARMLDGMIDSHKYNGEGKAVIFGDPELVYAVSKLCSENGIKPVLIATGAKISNFKLKIENNIDTKDKPIILNDTDFETIYSYVKKLDVNILIGNGDGKFMVEKEGIPLVRIGFPIHDRVGAQRRVFIGYEGSISFLDDITNTLIEQKFSSYREDLFDKYYLG